LTINDILLFWPLVLSIPLLVKYYFPKPIYSDRFAAAIVVGGTFWLLYGFFSEALSELIFGLVPEDAVGHEYNARRLADIMQLGRWDLVWEQVQVGNPLYQTYAGLIFFWTGASSSFMNASNGWFAFWGGLALASHLGHDSYKGKLALSCLLIIIFFPSAIFWATANLKEGLIYWAVCMTFTGTVGNRQFGGPLKNLVVIAGIVIGGLLRPQMMAAWLLSVLVSNVINSRNLVYSVIILAILIASMIGLRNKMGIDTPSEALSYQEDISERMRSSQRAGDIKFADGKPTLFVSGFVSIFFRPTPMDVRSLSSLLSFLETWLTTLLILVSWIKMTKGQRRTAIRTPEIQVALLAELMFCFALSYIPNLGLLVRQRLQAVPGLLVLAFWPILKFQRQERESRLELPAA
jgi:hypothetical protein